MAEKVGLGTRLRIFMISTGFVACVAGGGAIYLAFFHNATAARVGVLEKTTDEHTQQLQTHTGVLEQHGQRLDAHDTTLGQHGQRLDKAEGTLAEHGDAIAEQKRATGEAQAEAEAAGNAAAEAHADAVRLAEALSSSEARSAAEIAALKEQLAGLRAKVQSLEADQQRMLTDVLDRLAKLESATSGNKP